MRPTDLISFDALMEGPGRGYSPAALAKLVPPKGGPTKNANQKLPGDSRWISAGCVVLASLTAEGLTRCWIRLPSGTGYGTWAFPKGGIDPGESPDRAARREVLEETGVVCSLLPGGYLGMHSDSYAHNHYYMAVQARKNLSPHDNETKAIKLATFDEAEALFAGGDSETARDRKVLAAARAWVAAFKQKNGIT